MHTILVSNQQKEYISAKNLRTKRRTKSHSKKTTHQTQATNSSHSNDTTTPPSFIWNGACCEEIKIQ